MSEPSFSASVFKLKFDAPINAVFFAACANGGAGEPLLLTGSQTVSIKLVTSNSGNTIAQIHVQPEGLEAVGLISGDTYRGSRSPGQIMEIEAADGAPEIGSIFPQPIVLHGTSPGAAKTLLITTHIRFTVNNNGELTSFKLNFSDKCN